jgi:hypothetical protein
MPEPDPESSIPARRAEILLALAATAAVAPVLGLPFYRDDMHSIWQAAVTLQRPENLLEPWMGGLLRFIPKLLLVGVLALCGPQTWAFRLLNALLHAASVYLLARAVAHASGSRAVGLWTAGLFALGFGYYSAAVIQISNLTLVAGFTFALLAWSLWQRGRRGPAALALAAALLCHETLAVAVLLWPFLGGPGPEGEAAPRSWSPARRYLVALLILVGALSFLPGAAGRLAGTEMGYWVFAILPVNLEQARAAGVAGALATMAQGLAAIRPGLAYVALLAFLIAALRLRETGMRALGWWVVAALPFAAAITLFPDVWAPQHLGRRYLYLPAVGLCLLTASWLAGAGATTRRIALAAIVVWCVAWTGLTQWGFRREFATPKHRADYELFRQEMIRVDPRWESGLSE